MDSILFGLGDGRIELHPLTCCRCVVVVVVVMEAKRQTDGFCEEYFLCHKVFRTTECTEGIDISPHEKPGNVK